MSDYQDLVEEGCVESHQLEVLSEVILVAVRALLFRHGGVKPALLL